MPDRQIMAYPQLPEQETAELTPNNFQDVPIAIVGLKCRAILAMRLDVPQLLLGPSGHRDWRGLALLAGFSCDEVELLKERGKSPTASLLDQWDTSPVATVGRLLQHLMCLERYDVLDDIEGELRQDIALYRRKQSGGHSGVIHPPTVRSTRTPIYDAFVCYTSEDWPFVEVLIDKLESLGLRLFLPNRDLKAGVLQYSTFYELMEKWCRKTIIVFSPEFLESQECRVQQTFIESINNEQAHQKLIPVIVKHCVLKGTIQMISKINLCDNTPKQAEWNWIKLIESVRCDEKSMFVSAPTPFTSIPPSLVLPPGKKPLTDVPTKTPVKDENQFTSSTKKTIWRRIFPSKKTSSVSSDSSGFQSMASPE
uniref:Myeloid differentiation primary response protein myd88 n=1 Tax=Rhipicephalus zambeziensis TaxID=60191 RepID=A0A224Z3K7_9ACAR